ncbi:hypothetical protein TCAL_14705 [Tigriopus californicus]|uniref:Ribosome assembly factor mrt4 n=1 Tax=Tigriopus californicus TaxID=6832 RepID=A0A553PGY1_TIGCA|nr:hypothetical protein TCAL_14705 [Tigriopus californicus]
MPKSRRDRAITLSQTRKKPALEFKQSLVTKIRDAAAQHDFCYFVQVANNRNLFLKQLRDQWAGRGSFFLGKNRVMALALGRTEAEEIETGLHGMAKLLRNECGLLFTNRDQTEVVKFFEDYQEMDFARTGCLATDTVVLEAGPLTQFPHSLEPQLRALGDILTSEQARLLKLLGEKQAHFKLNMVAVWSKMKGEVKYLVEVQTMTVDQLNGATSDGNEVEEIDDE